jgi:ABC-type multidrug transport system ATPase subunit
MRSDEAAVLENVTFSVESGELMAVLAPQDAERR